MAVLGGATVPPHGPVMRALWGRVVSGPALATAYSLESVAVELCFVVGPLLTALLASTVSPVAAVLTAAVMATVGAVWLTVTPAVPAVQPHPAASGGDRMGPLRSPAVRALLITVSAVGIGFGAIEVALPAFVEDLGGRPVDRWPAPVGLGAGLGRRRAAVRRGEPVRATRRQLPVLVAALALFSALPLLADGVPRHGSADVRLRPDDRSVLRLQLGAARGGGAGRARRRRPSPGAAA
jgi:hypothetical protein